MATFSNFPQLWVSNIDTDINLYARHYEYTSLSYSVRDLIPMKGLIKEVIENLGIDSKMLNFFSIYTDYEKNNRTIFVVKSQERFLRQIILMSSIIVPGSTL